MAAARGEAERAGTLWAVADGIRQRIGVFDAEAFTVHMPQLDAIRATEPQGVAAGERHGRDLSVSEAIALALPEQEREQIAPALASW